MVILTMPGSREVSERFPASIRGAGLYYLERVSPRCGAPRLSVLDRGTDAPGER